jgi:hypothetical protein
MPENRHQPPKARTPWAALIASTLGALTLVWVSQILINAWWNPPAADEPHLLAAFVQVRAYFLAGIVWFVAGILLFVGRRKIGWSLLILGCLVILWSLPDR